MTTRGGLARAGVVTPVERAVGAQGDTPYCVALGWSSGCRLGSGLAS